MAGYSPCSVERFPGSKRFVNLVVFIVFRKLFLVKKNIEACLKILRNVWLLSIVIWFSKALLVTLFPIPKFFELDFLIDLFIMATKMLLKVLWLDFHLLRILGIVDLQVVVIGVVLKGAGFFFHRTIIRTRIRISSALRKLLRLWPIVLLQILISLDLDVCYPFTLVKPRLLQMLFTGSMILLLEGFLSKKFRAFSQGEILFIVLVIILVLVLEFWRSFHFLLLAICLASLWVLHPVVADFQFVLVAFGSGLCSFNVNRLSVDLVPLGNRSLDYSINRLKFFEYNKAKFSALVGFQSSDDSAVSHLPELAKIRF